MKKLFQILIAACMLPFGVIAQTENIETDRPSESLSPATVLRNHFQMEAGLKRQHSNNEGQRQDEYLYPSALLKYGLTKRLELRVLIENEVDYEYHPDKEKAAGGLEPVKVGFKYNLFDEKGILPKTSVIARASIPKWASPDFQSDFVAPLFRLALTNSITDKLKLVYNVGEEWEEDDVHGRFFYSISPQLEITDQFKIFVETFAYLSKERTADHILDAGFLYQFTPNVQFDAFAGVGLSKISANNFVDIGLSFRLPH